MFIYLLVKLCFLIIFSLRTFKNYYCNNEFLSFSPHIINVRLSHLICDIRPWHSTSCLFLCLSGFIPAYKGLLLLIIMKMRGHFGFVPIPVLVSIWKCTFMQKYQCNVDRIVPVTSVF